MSSRAARKRALLRRIGAPRLSFDFTREVLDSRINFSRASSGSRWNAFGYIELVSANLPRFDYDPTTLLPRGLLIEEQRTNSIRNSTMQGAVAGTPGTLPTNWAVGFPGLTGISLASVAVGVDWGLPYVDLRFAGTATSSGAIQISMEAASAIAAVVGQQWTGSMFWKLVAGSFAGIDLPKININEWNSSGVFLQTDSTTPASLPVVAR
jgi:hypothetical protein